MRDNDFYDKNDKHDPLNTPDVSKGPWKIVVQELDMFEFMHNDGRGGWAEWDADTGKLMIGQGHEQFALRTWDGDTFSFDELTELTKIIAEELPMEG